ncbi:hypothetical protein IF2G_04499 [Cordyceps javanica]|nr:hypothetical protein IF2G_04499 [Cordyceps javanica]
MQSDRLAAGERLRYWDRDVKALDHIDQSHGWHWTCIHCNFTSDSKESGRNHLLDAHGYQFRRAKANVIISAEYDKSMDELCSDMSCGQSVKSLGTLDHCGAFSPDHGPEAEEMETNLDIRILDDFTPSLEWSDSSDDVVNRLMDEWISLPATPSSVFTEPEHPEDDPMIGRTGRSSSQAISPGQNYIEDKLTMDPTDPRAPYYLLPTRFDTAYMKSDKTINPLETTTKSEWEQHARTDCTQFEEQPLCVSIPPTRQEIVIELRPVRNREEYESLEDLASTAEEGTALIQRTKKRDRLGLALDSTSKHVRSRNPGVSGQGKKTRRARISFTPNEDRLLRKLRADPTLTWEKIHALFSMEFPGRRSQGALQVHYSTKM